MSVVSIPDTTQVLWQSIQQSLQQAIGKERYQCFCSTLSLQHVSSGRLEFAVANKTSVLLLKQAGIFDALVQECKQHRPQSKVFLVDRASCARHIFEPTAKVISRPEATPSTPSVPEKIPDEQKRKVPERSTYRYVRSEENAELYSAVAALTEETFCPAILLVQGELGSGKTHFLRDLEKEYTEQGYKVQYFDARALQKLCEKQGAPFAQELFRDTLLLVDDVHFLRCTHHRELLDVLRSAHRFRIGFVCASAVSLENLRDARLKKIFTLQANELCLTAPTRAVRRAVVEELLQRHRKIHPLYPYVRKQLLTLKISMRTLVNAARAAAFYLDRDETTPGSFQTLLERFSGPHASDVQHIFRVVSTYYSLTKGELAAKVRTKKVVRPRQIAMYFMRTHAKKPFTEIGRIFGADHTTVIYACKKVKWLKDEASEYSGDISALEKQLGV